MRLSLFLAAAALAGCACFAAAPVIGTVTGSGSISDGATLTASAAPTDIHLASGVAVHLSPRSQGVIFRDHVVLDQGSIRVGHFPDYPVTAGQFQIKTDSPATEAVVHLNEKTIEVASLGGDLRVGNGAMITRVAAGTRLSFQQSGASPGQSGAAPVYRKTRTNHHVLYWVIGATAAAALAIGLTAAAQGKSL